MDALKKLQLKAEARKRFALSNRIANVLKTYGQNIRPVYNWPFSLTEKGFMKMLAQRPPDAVRCELLGTTLTIDITGKKKGEEQHADSVTFGCDNFDAFQDWFFQLLKK